jgi:hypothetical protein
MLALCRQVSLGRLPLGVNAGQQNRDEDEGGRRQGKVERLEGNVANNAIFKLVKIVSNGATKHLSCHRQSPTVVL